VRLEVSWSFVIQSGLSLQKGCGKKSVIKIEYHGCLISVFELVLGAVLNECLFAPPFCSGVRLGSPKGNLQSVQRVEPGVGFN
jgi:hypothetical protein